MKSLYILSIFIAISTGLSAQTTLNLAPIVGTLNEAIAKSIATEESEKEESVETTVKEIKKKPKADQLIEDARSWLGVRYVYGGTSRRGVDCSAFVQNVYRTNSLTVPRVAWQQAQKGKMISSRSKLKKGDLVFFKRKGRVSHVGIVTEIKKGVPYFIHASSSRGIMISSLNNSYWSPLFCYGKRIL